MTPPSPPRVWEPQPLFDTDDNDTNARYELSTIDAVREAALIMYGRFVANINNMENDDEGAKLRTNYLSLSETEAIIKEHGFVVGDTYAIGGDTPEEAKKQINALLAALLDRVMSNVLQEGVKQELLDCAYDTNTDDFAFSVTDKGRQKIEELRQNEESADS
jgi:hypothetical protein